jgi:hypothetical protein
MSMKYIGFVKEHDKNIANAIHFSQMINSTSLPNNLIEKVIEYLDKGILLFGAMGWFEDIENEGETITTMGYYTDGEWVWPSYFSYYLKKYPNFQIDEDFINYLSNKNFEFKVSDDLEDLLEEYEEDFAQKLDGK